MSLLAALALCIALDAPEQPFTFAVLGHLRGDANGEQLQNLDEVLDAVEVAHPDLVFLCGDLIWGDIDAPVTDVAKIRADWDALDTKLARLSMPVHRVPGNHDVNDVATRNVWLERYGALPKAFEFRGTKFLLLQSIWWPEDGSTQKHPQNYIRGKDLDAKQIEFVERELANRTGDSHAFVFMHQMLWWEDDAAWWRKVHPKLVSGHVEAVFGGDYGPLTMLQNRELTRILSAQFDNFVLVHVDGRDVKYEVRTVGALTTNKFTPAHFRDVNEYDKDTFGRKLFKRFATPTLLVRNLTIALLASFFAGMVFGLVWLALYRRRTRSRA
ncbi:MAG: metallophosphoesterase [Planctomycetes bacterium]|nr:metallophosphoesterase [Planctomycetota bacterium]